MNQGNIIVDRVLLSNLKIKKDQIEIGILLQQQQTSLLCATACNFLAEVRQGSSVGQLYKMTFPIWGCKLSSPSR